MTSPRVRRFVRVLRQELIEEFRQYGPKFSPILDEPQTEWPTSFSKRYVTLTGALRDSLRMRVTESSVGFDWPVPYSQRIRYGWVTRSGGVRRGRDWVALILKKHPVRDAVDRAARSAVGRSPRFRLIAGIPAL